jgi:hypothetical protein
MHGPLWILTAFASWKHVLGVFGTSFGRFEWTLEPAFGKKRHIATTFLL